MKNDVEQNYLRARDVYKRLGVDTDRALQTLAKIPISLHCWQGDDVNGFENDAPLSGGIAVTGNYPGRATTPGELQQDIETALSQIPGTCRLNLHAMYPDSPEAPAERNKLNPEHFQGWVSWAKKNKVGLDFNPSFFSHPLAESGATLSSSDEGIRNFWIQHAIQCRKIGAYFGKQLGSACVNNIWIPDGSKDIPADRHGPRLRLKSALDQIFAEKFPPHHILDSVECKLFGIGSESYVVGSHEFYLSYALQKNIMLCIDAGHFHPTENIADKISALLPFLPNLLLHVTRGVRWDSDHVVLLDDPTLAIAQEIVRGNCTDRIFVGTDFFDASINRIAAWVLGTRAVQKAFLIALLEPSSHLLQAEESKDLTRRLMLMEESKTLPWADIWDFYCLQKGVEISFAWYEKIMEYEAGTLNRRK